MLWRGAWLLLGGTLLSACTPHYPGEPVGSFRVVGSLEDNLCGPQAVPATDPVVFSVEIRRDGAQAWWRRPDAPLVEGVVEPDGTFRFHGTGRRVVVAPNPDAGVPGCALDQQEELTIRLTGEVGADAGVGADAAIETLGDAAVGDAGARPGLEGRHTIHLTPSAGSNCTPALAAAGGPFLAIPCDVDYALSGETTESF